ncbi:hypothetical protein KUCAC02_026527, partial [Chaenocephalus aceratus]
EKLHYEANVGAGLTHSTLPWHLQSAACRAVSVTAEPGVKSPSSPRQLTAGERGLRRGGGLGVDEGHNGFKY